MVQRPRRGHGGGRGDRRIKRSPGSDSGRARSALGRRFTGPDDPNGLVGTTPTTKTFMVVGVIAPMKLDTLVDTRAPARAYYFPLAQQPEQMLTFVVRTDLDPTQLARAVREVIQSVDRDLPVFDLQTMDRWTMKSLASRRATMLLVACSSSARSRCFSRRSASMACSRTSSPIGGRRSGSVSRSERPPAPCSG